MNQESELIALYEYNIGNDIMYNIDKMYARKIIIVGTPSEADKRLLNSMGLVQFMTNNKLYKISESYRNNVIGRSNNYIYSHRNEFTKIGNNLMDIICEIDELNSIILNS